MGAFVAHLRRFYQACTKHARRSLAPLAHTCMSHPTHHVCPRLFITACATPMCAEAKKEMAAAAEKEAKIIKMLLLGAGEVALCMSGCGRKGESGRLAAWGVAAGCMQLMPCLRAASQRSKALDHLAVPTSPHSQSGKSTIFKQMKILNKGGYTEKERKEFVSIVMSNTILSLGNLLDAYAKLSVAMCACTRPLSARSCELDRA